MALVSKIIKLLIFVLLLSPVMGFFAFKTLYPKQSQSASKAIHLCLEGVMRQANNQSNNQLAQFIAQAPDKSQKGLMKYLSLNFGKFIGFFDFSEYKAKPIGFNALDEGVSINASRSGSEQYVFQQGEQKYVLIGGRFYIHQNSNTYVVNGEQITYVPGHTVVQLPTLGLQPKQTAPAQVVSAQANAAQVVSAQADPAQTTPAPTQAAPAPAQAGSTQAAPTPAAPREIATSQASSSAPAPPNTAAQPVQQAAPKTPTLNKYWTQRSALQKARQVKQQYENRMPHHQSPNGHTLPAKPDASILEQIDNL